MRQLFISFFIVLVGSSILFAQDKSSQSGEKTLANQAQDQNATTTGNNINSTLSSQDEVSHPWNETRLWATSPTIASPWTPLEKDDCPLVKIKIGSTTKGTLGSSGCIIEITNTYVESYKFRGEAGQKIKITLEGIGFKPVLILLDKKHNVLASDEPFTLFGKAEILYTIPKNGKYLIFATSLYQRQIGAFELNLHLQ